MTDTTKCLPCIAIFAVGIIAVLATIGGWVVLQWIECREMGLTVLYCVQHVL